MMNLGGLGFRVLGGEGFLWCSNFDCNGHQQTRGCGILVTFCHYIICGPILWMKNSSHCSNHFGMLGKFFRCTRMIDSPSFLCTFDSRRILGLFFFPPLTPQKHPQNTKFISGFWVVPDCESAFAFLFGRPPPTPKKKKKKTSPIKP